MKFKKLFTVLFVGFLLICPTNALGYSNNYVNQNNIVVVSGGNVFAGDVNTNSLLTASTSEDTMHLCDKKSFIRLLRFLRNVVNLITLAAMIGLIISGSLTLFKAVTDEKEDLPKALKKFGEKLVLGAAIFILPIIVHSVFFTDNFITRNNDFLSKCSRNMQDSVFNSMSDEETDTFQTKGN